MSSKTRRTIFFTLFLLVSILFSFLLIYYLEEIKRLGSWHYLYIFLISFIAGSSLPIPAPYIVVVFVMAPVLSPFLVGLVAGLGCAIGGMLVYFFGRGGRWLFPWAHPLSYHSDSSISRWTHRITDWAKNRGVLLVFLMSVLVNPAFAPMAFALGALRFKTLKFFLMCWLGNTVKSLFIAYAGYFGLGFLLRLLGLSL